MTTPQSTKFKFGPWLPDLPDLDNPGVTEALNVLRIGGIYVPYLPLNVGSNVAISQNAKYALRYVTQSGAASRIIVGATDGTHGHLYVSTNATGGSWTDMSKAGDYTAVGSAPYWSIAQYNQYALATNGVDNPQYTTNPTSFSFADLTGAGGNAPVAQIVGTVGQFTVLGNIPSASQFAVQWSAINDPTNWPTPGSATAIATQSGIQYLDPAFAGVRGVSQGDQWGVILMDGGLYRMTYDGGNVVFQFDQIYREPGPVSQSAWVKAGQFVYFISQAGFFVTDGTTVIPIGRGKTDKYFLNRVDQSNLGLVQAGVDPINRLIAWTFPVSGGSGAAAEIIFYSIDEQTWTHAQDTAACFVRSQDGFAASLGFDGISTGNKAGTFSGTPGTATLTSPEVELNPGGRALLEGVRPQVSGSSSVTVSVGSRVHQSDSITYTGSLTPQSQTGFADCLIDSNYHRAQTAISGTFTQAIGGEFKSIPTSDY